MFFHMKTTLNVDDQIMARLKQEATRQGKTMSELFETALRLLLQQQPASRDLPPLPSFQGGVPRVSIASREATLDFMENR